MLIQWLWRFCGSGCGVNDGGCRGDRTAGMVVQLGSLVKCYVCSVGFVVGV